MSHCCLSLLIVVFIHLTFSFVPLLPFFLSCTVHGVDTEHETVWDQVAVAANQPPRAAPNVLEALFHLLDKTLLFKHLRKLMREKTVYWKAFYKTSVKWVELNLTQRDKSMSFWVSNLTDDVCLAIVSSKF